MKKANLLITIIFCSVLGITMAVSVFKPKQEYSDKENRFLELLPDFYIEDVLAGDYQESYENYINDQFPMREAFVAMATGIAKTTGRQDVNGVYIGKDGYLLEKYDDGDFDNSMIEDNCYLLAEFMNKMEEKLGSGHVSLLTVSGKANVLTNKLPKHAKPYDEDRVIDNIAEQLNNKDTLLYLRDTLKKHDDEYIYYRTDHHWTTLGAYYAYEKFCDWRGISKPDIEDYEREKIADDFYGTSYNKISMAVKPDVVELYHSADEKGIKIDKNNGELVSDSVYFPEEIENEADKYRIFLGGNTALITIDTVADNDKTLLLLKDSYANSFVPFLLKDYRRIIMIDLRYYSDSVDSLLNKHKEITDVMALYNIEKFVNDEGIGLLDIFQ